MNVPIKIFYHVALLNHWQEIVKEQLDTIFNCGLYAQCSDIYIGCVGDQSEREKLHDLVKEHSKIHISHHPDVKQYEFFTLKILKNHCNESPKFYGAYIHDKGCSYPNEPDKNSGKVWRDYLMYWTITNWKQNYKALDMKFMGYDLCCVKVIPKRVSPSESTHASGNMWMFNSEYIKSLKPIESLDNTNRFHAEMWVCSGEPIIYMPCNLFIDYINRQKSYKDFVENYPEFKDHCL